MVKLVWLKISNNLRHDRCFSKELLCSFTGVFEGLDGNFLTIVLALYDIWNNRIITHRLIVALWLHMATHSCVNIGSGNGLLPDGIKPLLEPMSPNHQWGFVAFTWGQFHNKCSRYLSLICVWILQPYFPETNELRLQGKMADISKFIFLNENCSILIQISLKFTTFPPPHQTHLQTPPCQWYLPDSGVVVGWPNLGRWRPFRQWNNPGFLVWPAA